MKNTHTQMQRYSYEDPISTEDLLRMGVGHTGTERVWLCSAQLACASHPVAAHRTVCAVLRSTEMIRALLQSRLYAHEVPNGTIDIAT